MAFNDLQDSVHQAVDIGFGLADLLGSLFGMSAEQRLQYKRTIHTLDSNGSQIQLSLNDQNQPMLSCTGPSTTFAVVVPSTTQTQTLGNVPPGQVATNPIVLQGGTQILFQDFPDFTKGMLTATQVDTTQTPGPSGQAVAAATMCNFTTADQVPLISQPDPNSGASTPVVSLSVGSNSFTVYNDDPNNPYMFAATITTTSPNQTFTLSNGVGASGQAETPFPGNIGSAVIAQMTLVLSAVPQGSYTLPLTAGAIPLSS